MTAMRQRGMTLVELLVALAIFALVSAASIAVLDLAMSGSVQLEDATDEVRRMERARSLLRADLSQVAPRPVRDRDGRERPAFVGGTALPPRRPGAAEADDEEVLLVLTRSGWRNPGDLRPRAELQRVTYLLRGAALVRRTRPFLDAGPETPNQDQTLFDDVADVEIAFYDGTAWQPGFAGTAADRTPAAVRLAFDHPRLGRMRHDFLAGPG